MPITFTGVISGDGALIKQGRNVGVYGSSPNTYGGGTSIERER